MWVYLFVLGRVYLYARANSRHPLSIYAVSIAISRSNPRERPATISPPPLPDTDGRRTKIAAGICRKLCMPAILRSDTREISSLCPRGELNSRVIYARAENATNEERRRNVTRPFSGKFTRETRSSKNILPAIFLFPSFLSRRALLFFFRPFRGSCLRSAFRARTNLLVGVIWGLLN